MKMKYVDADKLIAEIERYKQEAATARFDNSGENADYFQGKVDLCDDLTHIITTLQQEQPEESKWWWSEADSGDLKLVMSLVESDLGEKSPTVLWLKSLPKRFNLLARHVWSEKDIERVATYLHESRHGILWGKAKEMAQDICEILCPL